MTLVGALPAILCTFLILFAIRENNQADRITAAFIGVAGVLLWGRVTSGLYQRAMRFIRRTIVISKEHNTVTDGGKIVWGPRSEATLSLDVYNETSDSPTNYILRINYNNESTYPLIDSSEYFMLYRDMVAVSSWVASILQVELKSCPE
ncbi:MAG TPA: hypothetical protein VGK19_15175 [Capsulimonadaceae bacterium]